MGPDRPVQCRRRRLRRRSAPIPRPCSPRRTTAGRFGGFDLPIVRRLGWRRRSSPDWSPLAHRRADPPVARRLSRHHHLRRRRHHPASRAQPASPSPAARSASASSRAPSPRCRRTRCCSTCSISRWSLAVVIALYLALERLLRSPWGRVLRAIREDETAALSLGKNARAYRLQAFALGGAIMGLAGAMQGHFIGFIAPDNYVSDAHLPGLGHADRRRRRQQSRRAAGRGAGVGPVERLGRRSSPRCSRPSSRPAPPPCRSS